MNTDLSLIKIVYNFYEWVEFRSSNYVEVRIPTTLHMWLGVLILYDCDGFSNMHDIYR